MKIADLGIVQARHRFSGPDGRFPFYDRSGYVLWCSPYPHERNRSGHLVRTSRRKFCLKAPSLDVSNSRPMNQVRARYLLHDKLFSKIRNGNKLVAVTVSRDCTFRITSGKIIDQADLPSFLNGNPFSLMNHEDSLPSMVILLSHEGGSSSSIVEIARIFETEDKNDWYVGCFEKSNLTKKQIDDIGGYDMKVFYQ